MIENLRIWPHILERILTGPLGPYVDRYTSWLNESGYSRRGIRRQIQAVDRFGAWLAARGLTASDVSEQIVELFVCVLRRTPSTRCARGRLPNTADGARRIAEFLWTHGIVVRQSDDELATRSTCWLRSYDNHLHRVHGLSEGTRCHYLRYARRFVEARFGDDGPDWSLVTADDITDFVCVEAQRLKPSSCRGPVTATRTMLRFLAVSGAVVPALVGAVPTVRQWRLAGLPHYLTDDQLKRVLDHGGDGSPLELRDRAVLWLLARLGLRASEVAHLALDDLDWVNGRVRIVAGKSGAERSLPLLQEVGEALAAYLRSRGHVDGLSFVFLGAKPPHPRPLTAAAVTGIAQRALRRAGVAMERSGAHVFRHTAATQMVRRGATFKQVADILGHALIETTTIYAKLDVDTLSRVALPWPGSKQ